VKPHPVAVIFAAILAAYAALAYGCGWHMAAVVIAAFVPVTLALFWRAPLCDEDGSDIEALMRATREHPQFADWDIRELTP
jgi:hypothetical protein